MATGQRWGYGAAADIPEAAANRYGAAADIPDAAAQEASVVCR